MRIFTALCLCAVLAACQPSPTAGKAYDDMGNEAGKSYNKLGEMMGLKQPPPPKPPTPQTRYCYHTYNDIICYSKPMPGEEYRLVGYQQSNGKAGYIMDPPAPVRTKVTDVGADAVKPSSPPPLKSVIVGPPPPVKATDKPPTDKQLKEVIFDPAELEPKELVPDKPQ